MQERKKKRKRKTDAYLEPIFGFFLRILLQLLHFHIGGVQLSSSLTIIIPENVADAWVNYVREDAVTYGRESQEEHSDAHHHAAAASAAADAAAAAALWDGCGEDAKSSASVTTPRVIDSTSAFYSFFLSAR